MRKYIVFILVIFVHFKGKGQNENLIFNRLTTKTGLSETNIRCIYQDFKGYIWIGTEDGINKYDGVDFLVYRKEDYDSTSIWNSHITEIFEDNDSNFRTPDPIFEIQVVIKI